MYRIIMQHREKRFTFYLPRQVTVKKEGDYYEFYNQVGGLELAVLNPLVVEFTPDD